MTSIDTTREQLTEIFGQAGLKVRFASAVVPKILAEFIVIPRSDLPEPIVYEDQLFGTTVQFGSQHFRGSNARIRREQALQFLALAEHLEVAEAAQSAEAAAAEKLSKRRDELAVELGRLGSAYPIDSPMGRAIDRIIELEAGDTK